MILMILSSFLYAEDLQQNIDAKKVCADVVYGLSRSSYTSYQEFMLISMLSQAQAIYILPSVDENYIRRDLENANELMKKACQLTLNKDKTEDMFKITYVINLIIALKK